MPAPSKDDTINHFIFGDYDDDGVLNIDDPAPFNPDISDWPNPRTNPDFYHQSQFGGPDLKFSDVLLTIKEYNDSFIPDFLDFLENNPGSFGRIKSVPSTINKVIRKPVKDTTIPPIEGIRDIAGITLVMKDRAEVYDVANEIQKNYDVVPDSVNDFYRGHEPDNPYRGIHQLVVGRTGSILEVQARSKPFDELAILLHPLYKAGADISNLLKKPRGLWSKGIDADFKKVR